MLLTEWEARYRSREREHDFALDPVPLVVRSLQAVQPGRALDLACGTGRNALWLAQQGWNVTAVDGSETAIAFLRKRAGELGVSVDTRVADLGSDEFPIEPDSCEVILDCYYLQRDLFPGIRAGVRRGGLAIAIVHLAYPGEPLTYKHAGADELRGFFEDWDILHYREGTPDDSAHRRPAAEIVARRP